MDGKRAQEALMDGQARFEEWAKKFMDDWQMPQKASAIKMIYSQMPPEAKDQLKAQDPAAYEDLTKFISKKKWRK